MSSHVLSRPVWSALSTRQAALAVGGDRARRFPHDIGPLAASHEDDPRSLEALAELVPADGSLILLQADPVVVPARLVATSTTGGVQMVAERIVHKRGDIDNRIEPLGAADIPAMLALATLTQPGPFASRTASLGDFLGVKHDGALVAMAGERMKQPGFTELSAVCVHPDVRGRGLGRALSAAVAARILERGETPYLHAYATNTNAIELYSSLGFRLRSAVNVVVVALRAPARR